MLPFFNNLIIIIKAIQFFFVIFDRMGQTMKTLFDLNIYVFIILISCTRTASNFVLLDSAEDQQSNQLNQNYEEKKERERLIFL